jgi:hypothetical protein
MSGVGRHESGRARALAAAVTVAVIACVGVAAATSRATWPDFALVLALPFAFAAAGVVAVRRQPRALPPLFVMSVGLAHLVAFVLTGVAVLSARHGVPAAEASSAAAASVSYLLGFVALVGAAATLPVDRELGRRARQALRGLVVLAVVPPLVAAVTAPRQRLVLQLDGWGAHINAIFTKLDLPPSGSVHRRVAAVLAFLDARA